MDRRFKQILIEGNYTMGQDIGLVMTPEDDFNIHLHIESNSI
jgi:hypothetical protein